MRALKWLGSLKQQLQQQEAPKQQKKQLGETDDAALTANAELHEMDKITQMAMLALLGHPLPSIKVSLKDHSLPTFKADICIMMIQMFLLSGSLDLTRSHITYAI